jgi:hypothetical protein
MGGLASTCNSFAMVFGRRAFESNGRSISAILVCYRASRATATKESELVADKCQKCRGDLYCEACKEISKHRPFDKQAIEIFLTKTGLSVQLIDDFFYVRNNLMHGEPREKIEAKIKSRDSNFEFNKIIDLMEHQPKFLQVSTYVDWKRSVTAHIIIGVPGDPNNPKIEDLHLPTISFKPTSPSPL